MIRTDILIPKNDVIPIRASLMTPLGILTVTKKRGIPADSHEEQVMKFVRDISKIGKIFETPVLRTNDLATGKKDDEPI